AAAWANATAYKAGDCISSSGLLYKCLVAHTSATFATDLAAGDWSLQTVFDAGQVRGYFQIAHWRDSAFISQDFGSTNITAGLKILGAWDLTTFGIWTGTLLVQRSYDNVNWNTIRTFTGAADRNVSNTGNEQTQAWIRLNFTRVSSSGVPRAELRAADARQYGFVKIKTVTNSTTATADVVVDLAATTATSYWSEGAFSTLRGYPQTVCLFEDRIMYGGTSSRPLTIKGSVVDDFDNFRLTAFDDGALSFTLSSQEANTIQWMLPQDQLLVGTSGDEWTLGASDNTGLTPTNVQALKQASYGSAAVRALIANDTILFLQRLGRKVRQLIYVNGIDKQGWIAEDLTILSDHVTRGNILEVAFQPQQDAIYWAITGKGQLIGMTYERLQSVAAWHRHTTGVVMNDTAVTLDATNHTSAALTVYGDWTMTTAGQWKGTLAIQQSDDHGATWKTLRTYANSTLQKRDLVFSGTQQSMCLLRFLWTNGGVSGVNPSATLTAETRDLFESVATIYGTDENDETWVSVNRMINGQTVRCIERFKTDFRTTLENEDKANWWYLDAAKAYVFGSPTSAITGLSHLEGMTVGILADGAVQEPKTVVGGNITLDSPASTVLVGLPYVSTLQPMKLEIQLQDGTSVGRRKKINRISADIYKSLGGKFSVDSGATWDPIYSRTTFDVMDSSPPVFTGMKRLYTGGDYNVGATITLRQDQPLPLTVLALIPTWMPYGD
ncbi:MAG: carbohydrate-binding protein, partial [Chthoniobacterales bacterium]